MFNTKLFRRLLCWLLALLCLGCARQNSDQNLKAGDAFLAENANKPGVVVMPSGLQYTILQSGTGLQPTATDGVTVNYRGELIDGSEFDSGQGISFPLNGVIAGWTEGLQLMKEGSKFRFFIPSSLAYGERGAGRVIPPNAALVFDVELTKVNR